MIDSGEPQTAYLIARDAALPTATSTNRAGVHRGWIALRFLNDPQPPHSIRANRRRQRQPPRWRRAATGRPAAEAPAAPRTPAPPYRTAAEQSTSYYGNGARQLGLPQLDHERRPNAESRGVERLEVVRAVQLLFDSTNARSPSRSLPTWRKRRS